jgi:copper chaperone CopZ
MKPHSLELEIEGMTCAHCLRAVEHAIAELPGVSEVRVDLKAGRALVAGQFSEDSIIRAVQNEGYEARAVHSADQKV